MKHLSIIFNMLILIMLPGGRETVLKEQPIQPKTSEYSNTVYSSLAPAPKYFKNPLKLSMTPQSGHTCLPSMMGYINQELCKGSYITGHYIDQYEDAHPGVDVEENGIVGSKRKVMDYIELNFHTRTYSQAGGIVASIDAGHPLLTTILSFDNTGFKQIHNILIVGYDSSAKNNPKVYYMDSRYGSIFNDIDVAEFNASAPAYIFSITGCK